MDDEEFEDLWDAEIVASDYPSARICGLASAMLARGWLRGSGTDGDEAALAFVADAYERGAALWREWKKSR